MKRVGMVSFPRPVPKVQKNDRKEFLPFDQDIGPNGRFVAAVFDYFKKFHFISTLIHVGPSRYFAFDRASALKVALTSYVIIEFDRGR